MSNSPTNTKPVMPVRETGSVYHRPDISRQRPSHAPPRRPIAPPRSHTAPKTVEIKLSMPKLPRIPRRFVLAGIVGLIIIFGYIALFKPNGLHVIPGSASAPTVTTSSINQKPDFATITRDKRPVERWVRVSPPGKNAVFAYADKVGTVELNVSEQPLPDAFKNDTADQIKKLAESYQAGEKVTVGDTIVYVGTSSDGPQSVILTKSDLLVLIKTSAKLTSGQWAEYVNSLR